MVDRFKALLLVCAVGVASPLSAQSNKGTDTPESVGQAKSVTNSAEDDIVISGYRLRKDVDTAVSYPTAISTSKNRIRYDNSERMAKCAGRSRLSDFSLLRQVVDGEFNSARHAYAQDRLARTYATCGEGSGALLRQGNEATEMEAVSAFTGDSTPSSPNIEPYPLGHSIYDRGALTIQVMKMFAPDLTLTLADTQDPAVQARFNVRELARNRYRLPIDYAYFEVAVCMTRLQPTLAVQLALSDGSARFGDVQAALIDRARPCVGGAKKVLLDPSQFRVYVADAVYRWVVATRNVASLIPSG